jgi:hypothetical protein
MPSYFLNIPNGADSWLTPVSTFSALPALAAPGDAVVTLDTFDIWVWNGTAWVNETSGGTVTSVGLADTSTTPIFAVSGSPVTISGTLDLTLIPESANTVFAGPASGSAAQPTFRALVSNDIPNLSATYVTQSEVGVANGVASLGSGGKVPTSQLPANVFLYEGLWNPSTNSPSLVDGSGIAGYTYWVSAAFPGSVSGLNNASMYNFNIGDLVIYNGTQWELTTPAAGVQSVNGTTGAVTVNAINQLTGDITAGPASGSQSKLATLATVNSSPSTYSNATITVNAKGLVTSASSGTAPVTSVSASSPLNSSGGTTPNLTLSASGVSASSYTYSSITVDTYGRVTAASSGTPPTTYTFADSLVNTSGTVTLRGDSASPSSNSYYGTGPSNTTLGYYSVPSGVSTPGSTTSGNIVTWNSSTGAAIKDSGLNLYYNSGNGSINITPSFSTNNDNATVIGGSINMNGASPGVAVGTSIYNESNNNILLGANIGSSTYPINSASTIIIGGNTGGSSSWTGGGVFVGYECGGTGNTGGNNIAIGYYAGNNGTAGMGVNAIAIGNQAGAIAGGTTALGANSVMIGSSTGSSNNPRTSGVGSVFIGSLAGYNYGNNYNILIGYNADVDGSSTRQTNNLVIGGGTSSTTGQIYDVWIGSGMTVANAGLHSITYHATSTASGVSNASAASSSMIFAGAQGTGTGTGGDIIFQIAPSAASASTLNSLSETFRVKANQSVAITAAQTTLTGSAGTAVCSQPLQGSSYKKVVIYLSGYTDTGTQTYTYPTAFTNTPYVYGLAAGVSGATASSTTVTFSVTTQTGFVFIEGY